MTFMPQANVAVKPQNTGLAFFKTLSVDGLRHGPRRVLRELAYRTWNKGKDVGYSMCGHVRLCAALGISPATLNRHLNKLEAAGLIKRIRRGRRRGAAWGGRLMDKIELVGFRSWSRRMAGGTARIYSYCSVVLNKVQPRKFMGGVSSHFESLKETIQTLTTRTAQAADPEMSRRAGYGPDEADWASLAVQLDRHEVLA
jgi:DNA-binding transcriptional ArsR family regulator